MNNNLKLFQTTAQYDAFAASTAFTTPNVSAIESEIVSSGVGVRYNPYTEPPTPPTPTHEYVEIGGVKWATMNVGATAVTDGGLYFRWGETQGYTTDNPSSAPDYKYYSDGQYTKYNKIDNLTELQASDDAVTAAWGGNWRMPTLEEVYSLWNTENIRWDYVDNYLESGMNGMLFTDSNTGNVLFFPFCGETGMKFYWTKTLDEFHDEDANVIYFDIEEPYYSNTGRSNFLNIRGVLDE